jgi:hypothetical protein
MTFTGMYSLLFFILCTISPSFGQDVVGTDVCACQPTVYELTFDLSLSCSDNTINGTIILPGLNGVNCVTFSGPDSSADRLIPVTISDVMIEETNKQFETIGKQTYSNIFRTGDSIQYTSSIDNSTSDSIDVDNIPHSITVTLNGNTEDNLSVVNSWIITFTNDCQTFPVIYDGLTIGWTRLVSVTFSIFSNFEIKKCEQTQEGCNQNSLSHFLFIGSLFCNHFITTPLLTRINGMNVVLCFTTANYFSLIL